MQPSALASLNQFVQEFVDGTIRRNTFTPKELELLLDLQACRIRKSAKAEALRRYVKAMQRRHASDGSAPMRFSQFLEQEQQQRLLAQAAVQTLPHTTVEAR